MLSVFGVCIILSGLCVCLCECVRARAHKCVCFCCAASMLLPVTITQPDYYVLLWETICFSMSLYLPPSYVPINRIAHCVWGSVEFGSWVLLPWCETAFTKHHAHQYFTVQWIPKQCHYSNLGPLKGTPCAVDPVHKLSWKLMKDTVAVYIMEAEFSVPPLHHSRQSNVCSCSSFILCLLFTLWSESIVLYKYSKKKRWCTYMWQ